MARNLSVLKQTTEKEIPKVVTSKKIRIDSLMKIQPKTDAQKLVFDEYNNNKHLILVGSAGTGKNFCSVYLAMKEILTRDSLYKKLVVVRSAVPVRNQGFLPGTLEEKEVIYEMPYHAIFKEIFQSTPDNGLIEKLKEQHLYEFISTSYLRGITLHNSIVMLDEVQDLTYHEIATVITRLGENCKIIICGDTKQTDLKLSESGINHFLQVAKKMSKFSKIVFTIDDIVRSEFVKEFLIADEATPYGS